MELVHIEYDGKSIDTKNYVELSQEEFEELRKQYYQKPSKQEVINQMKKIAKGGVMMDKITRYYFRELMSLVQISTAKCTVNDVLNSPKLLGIFKAKTLNNEKVFPPDKPLIKNIETAIRLGGKAYAKIPTQYPLKSVYEILLHYNINNNWYDFSCGWGARLLGALVKNVNYYGTDPNNLLIDKLQEMVNDYPYKKPNVHLYCQGSEIDIPELHNKIGLAFSSPPYYNLEDYKIGNQSYKQGVTYQQWLSDYFIPSIDNIYNYLIDNGYLALNIKDINGYSLVQDTYKIINKKFTLVDIIDLKNISRINSLGELNNNDELIYIYKKN